MIEVEVHNPGNAAPIDELYVFMSIDEAGRHGIIASVLPGLGSTPLVTGSAKAAEIMKKLAVQTGGLTGLRVGMFVFKRDAMVWEKERNDGQEGMAAEVRRVEAGD